MNRTIYPIIEDAADRWPDRKAVVAGEEAFTWSEIRDRTVRLALHLRACSVGKGDRVAILSRNTPGFFAAYFAAAGAGAVLVPVNHRLAPREIAHVLDDSGAGWLLHDAEFADLAALSSTSTDVGLTCLDEPLPPANGSFRPAEVRPGDLAHLYYTSGTTGRPKGVMLTHENVTLHADRAVEELSISGDDVWGHIAPMFHLADAWATFAVTRVGGRHVMVPSFSVEAVLDAISGEKVTLSNLIPTMLNLVVRHPAAQGADFGSLRVILSGGAPIAPELVRCVMETFGCDYVQTYGMTETSPYLTLSILAPHLRRLSAEERLRIKARTGRPFKGIDLEVVAEDGRPVVADDREVGEIRVRGETVSPGYWNRPEETREAFRDGWLHTGDLAVIDAEGSVNIVDRRKDMIICGGENVYSTEVENVLYECPKVLEAAVIGIPDETWGEVVLAVVALRPGEASTEEEIRAFCRARLAGFKTPKRVEFLPALPRTGSGKLYKAALRREYRGRGASAADDGREG